MRVQRWTWWTQMESCGSFQCLKHHCNDSHMETWWERRMLANCGRIAAYSIACTYYHFVSWRSTVTQSLPSITWTSQYLNNMHMNFNRFTELPSNLMWIHQFCFCTKIIVPSALDLCHTHSFTSQRVWSLVKETGSATGQIQRSNVKRRNHQQVKAKALFSWLLPAAFQ